MNEQPMEARNVTGQSELSEKKIFAQGYCFVKIFVFFVLGCIIGTYYEEILWYIRFHEKVNRQGIFYGPFSPIYGLGVWVSASL